MTVRLIAHAKNDDTGRANAPFLDALRQGGAPNLTIVERQGVPRLSHNKVVVHTTVSAPRRVWSGSTNFTDQGFFRQTNVGVIVDDSALAGAYAAYLDLLAADPPAARLRRAVRALVDAQPSDMLRRVFFASPTR